MGHDKGDDKIICSYERFLSKSGSVENLVIGNDSLNMKSRYSKEVLREISFNHCIDVKVIDIGSYSLKNISSLSISSMMIDD